MKYVYTVYDNEILVAENIGQKKMKDITGMKSTGNLDYYLAHEVPYKGRFLIIQDELETPTTEILEEWDRYCNLFNSQVDKKVISNITLIGIKENGEGVTT
jgi:hypothetical protein